tara:strand:+ start:227 stop:565 length:339 start_codon:yes stop_codon:yes gene_type:complete
VKINLFSGLTIWDILLLLILIKRKDNMTKENNKMFFVIRKDKWPAGNIKYTIMKDKPFTLTDATRMLLAYEQINDDKDHTYHLNSVDEYLEDSKSTVIKSGVLKLTEDMEVN